MGRDGLGDVTIEGVDPVDMNVIQPEAAAVAMCRLVSEHPGQADYQPSLLSVFVIHISLLSISLLSVSLL